MKKVVLIYQVNYITGSQFAIRHYNPKNEKSPIMYFESMKTAKFFIDSSSEPLGNSLNDDNAMYKPTKVMLPDALYKRTNVITRDLVVKEIRKKKRKK